MNCTVKDKLLRYGTPVALCLAVLLAAVAVWPGVMPVRLVGAFAMVGIIVALAWHACRWRSYAGAMLLLVALTLLLCGTVANVNYFTYGSGGTLTHPVLQNTDAYLAWWAGVALIAEDVVPMYFVSYPTYLVITLFARDIFIALMPGVLCALLTLVSVGELTWQLTRRRDMATAAMVAMSLMCYFMVQATVLIKDVPLTLGMCLTALAFMRWYRKAGRAAATWGLALAGWALVATYRPNMLYFIVLGAVIFAVRRRPDWQLAVIVVLSLVVWAIIDSAIPGHPDALRMAAGSPKYDISEVKTIAWDKVSGHYSQFPVWKKLCLLPASMVLQFLIPFPWNWCRDTVFGPTVAIAHFGFFWYLAGGVFLYWLFTSVRRSPALMVRVALWGVLLYAAIAYSYNGRISRYYMPEIPLIMPAVAYTVITAWRTRRFRIWMCTFCVLMAVALVICHHLHTQIL